MFQPRSKDFSDPHVSAHVSAIVDHLRAIQDELAEIGRKAGRRSSASAAAAGDQIADAMTPILKDMTPILKDIVDRLWRGQRAAVDGAANMGDQAVKIGTRIGSDALGRISDQAKERPLLTLAVAIGVGILIGAAGRRN